MGRGSEGPSGPAAGDAPPLASEILQGSIERVTYADPHSLYLVLRIAPEKGFETPSGSLFRAALVTAVGRGDAPAEGLRVRLSGRWTTHKTHGPQFEFDLLEVLAPGDRAGLVKYLSSSRFKGIGPKLAERIADALGENAIEVALERPELLARVQGMRPAIRDQFVQTLLAEHGSHRANVFLRGLGLGPWQTSAVLRELGPDCEEVVRADPFVLASGIAGIGFGTADRVATALGIAPDDPRRVRAGLVQTLKLAAEEGHSMLPRERLLHEAEELLSGNVSEAVLGEALAEVDRAGEVVIEGVAPAPETVWLPLLQRCESELARNLAHLLRSGPVQPWATPRDLEIAERRVAPETSEDRAGDDAFGRHAGIELHPLQREAVLGLLSTPVGLLTGGPGVGKTTIVKMVVDLALAAHARVLLASPTGRAAKRLAEATGREAQTIHRLLGWQPPIGRFLHDPQNPVEADLVVVDEISMLDVALAHHLVRAIQPPTRIVFVGDPNQLPSVGPGNVLHDLLLSGAIPVYRLTRIYRQAEGSLIVENAHRILEGESPRLPPKGDRDSDFYVFHEEDPTRCAELLVDVVTRRIPGTFGLSWIDDVQVIAPMYRGECGVDALNERLREELARTPETADLGGRGHGRSSSRHTRRARKEIRQGGRVWREGDRVIHTRNDYEKEVFNGDMGRVASVVEGPSPGLIVRYPEREVPYTTEELGDLQPAFAITVHRSQGGEFPAVVIPLVMQHWMMLQRHLLYTAVTRAKRLVVLVGSHRALQVAIENAEQAHRESALAGRLRALLGAVPPR